MRQGFFSRSVSRITHALPIFLALTTSAHAAERVRVALLPVVVHSGESGEYLQHGLADMLVARLGRDPRLAVVEVEDPAAATTEVGAAREAARKAGADYVVFGSFTRFGEGASLDLQCTRTAASEGEPRRIFAQATTLGGLIPMLEGVSEKVSGYVLGGESGAPSAATSPAASDGELAELRRRLEALERAVYSAGAVERPAAGPEDEGTPAPKPPVAEEPRP